MVTADAVAVANPTAAAPAAAASTPPQPTRRQRRWRSRPRQSPRPLRWPARPLRLPPHLKAPTPMQRWLRPRTPRPTGPRSIRRAQSAKPSAPQPLLPTPPPPRVLRRPLQWSQRRLRHRNPPFSSRTPLSRGKAPQLPANRTARPARQTPPQPQHQMQAPSFPRSRRTTEAAGKPKGENGMAEAVKADMSRQSRHANGCPRQRAFGDRGCRPHVAQFFRQRPSGCRRDPDAATICFDGPRRLRLNSPPPQPQAPRCP